MVNFHNKSFRGIKKNSNDDNLKASNQKVLIIGGGPNGLYSALLLLESFPKCFVHVIECRQTARPQVIRLPFSAIDDVPDKIKCMLWPDVRVRQAIFGDRSRLDSGFWPRCDYKYFPFIQIGEFQKVLKQYMEEKFGTEQFRFEEKESCCVDTFNNIINDYDLALVSAGNCSFTKTLRKVLNVSKVTTDDDYRDAVEKRGVYLIFETPDKELYERSGQLIKGPKIAAKGITYAHSNDSSNHLQIYTYPVGELRQVFAEMPESFKATAAFTSSNKHLTFDGKIGGEISLSSEEQRWFYNYSSVIRKTLSELQIPFPTDDKISVYYASRGEYFYDEAAAFLREIPVLFVGDACGGTDYKFGLSLGRGLIMTLNLVDEMKRRGKIAFAGIADYCNYYWKDVIDGEFDKRNPLIIRTAEMVFKYIMEGRIVDGKQIDKTEFIKEFNLIENSEIQHCTSQQICATKDISSSFYQEIVVMERYEKLVK